MYIVYLLNIPSNTHTHTHTHIHTNSLVTPLHTGYESRGLGKRKRRRGKGRKMGRERRGSEVRGKEVGKLSALNGFARSGFSSARP